MVKVKDKRRQNVSVATEIERLEERRARCHDKLEEAHFRSRKAELSAEERHQLEKQRATITERMQNLDKELRQLRAQNRTNAMLSVAVLAVCALFYFIFVVYDHHRHS
ncbi:coiled-coil domain-containing protein 167 [Syngnathus typhle]|uniref:coiled-coil domain-containing protein 167 n=1 Tax=Syngnathus typhle TaxID=161592 RepID=UPI002A6B85A7|nr:coiled-coil domain-containing protein 167 [Syngnathus typhle]